MSSAVPNPRFVIIGAQKSATRWLRVNLGMHPEIFTAGEELWYFNLSDRKWATHGLDWYKDQFERWNGEPIVGESTPGYMMLRHDPSVVAKRIDETLPDVRLIAVLRDPVARAQSALTHHKKAGRIPGDRRLYDIVKNEPGIADRRSLLDGGRYGESLRPYVERFGERLLVMLHDDVKEDAANVYRQSVAHVGASPGFIPPGLGEVRYSNQKRARPSGRPPVTDEERAELFEIFRDDVELLEELIGRDLSCWRPGS